MAVVLRLYLKAPLLGTSLGLGLANASLWRFHLKFAQNRAKIGAL